MTKRPAHRPRKGVDLRSEFLTLRLTPAEKRGFLERAAKAKAKPTTFARVELGLAP